MSNRRFRPTDRVVARANVNLPPGYSPMPRSNNPNKVVHSQAPPSTNLAWTKPSVSANSTFDRRMGAHRSDVPLATARGGHLPQFIDEYDPAQSNMVPTNYDPNQIRIGLMYYDGQLGPIIAVVNYDIDSNTTYGQLAQNSLDRLEFTSDYGVYWMTANGIYRVDRSNRPIYNQLDLDLIGQVRNREGQYDLLFHIHDGSIMKQLGCDNYLDSDTIVKRNLTPTDPIISNGGPSGYNKYWIDLSQSIRIKVAVAPCDTCTSSDNCYIGLVYGDIVAAVEIKVGPTNTYEQICDMIKDQLDNISDQTGIYYPEIQQNHLYLYVGNVYYDLSDSKRLVYQDYTLWQYWTQLSNVTGQEYGPYFHLCQPNKVHSTPLDFETDMTNLHVLPGGNHNIMGQLPQLEQISIIPLD